MNDSVFVEKINQLLCKEYNCNSSKEFEKKIVTYSYYLGENEYKNYSISLSLLIDNFDIYANSENIIKEFENSSFEKLSDFLIQEWCPQRECLGGDKITE